MAGGHRGGRQRLARRVAGHRGRRPPARPRPLLHAVFKQDKRWLDKKKIDAIADDARSRWKPTPASASPCPPAAQALARTLVDLFDSPSASLKLSRFDAPRLADALGDGWQGNGIDGLAAWLERIKGAAHLKPVAAPPASPSPCAPTSSEGLAWLQHLREHGLGGILADDMGLGKTAQALAHLLTEKHAGASPSPRWWCCPPRWCSTGSARPSASPRARVLSLRGRSRAEAFAKIPEHDVCLTTYPLLWRDREQLPPTPTTR
jgi:SNF2 family DNA or RNA helicase